MPRRPKTEDPSDFDAFRRRLILKSKVIAKEEREEWFAFFSNIIEKAFPAQESRVNRPGVAHRLFSAEIAIPRMKPEHLLGFAREFETLFQDALPVTTEELRTHTYQDRLDVMWEFAIDLGDAYITGAVKLRNFDFKTSEYNIDDRPGSGQYRKPRDTRDRGRPPYRDRPQGDRPPRRDFGDRPPRRDFGDRPQGDRPPRRDFNDRPQGDRPPRRDFNDRPQGDRPPRRDFNDRPQGDRPPRRDFNDRPPRRDFNDRPQGDRPPRRDFNDRPQGDRPPRRDFGDRPPRRDFNDRPQGDRPQSDRPRRDFGPKKHFNKGPKKTWDKNAPRKPRPDDEPPFKRKRPE